MSLSRRSFLSKSGAVAAGFLGLRACVRRQSSAATVDALRDTGYGDTIADADGILDLPKGFSYKIISRAGERMDDRFLLPGRPDGMAAFPGPDGMTILIRNHELNPDQTGPWGKNNELLQDVESSQLYDFGHGKTPGTGGTTTVVYDEKQRQVVRQFMSLAGTIRNCAGGPTPWNTWITCEETVQRVGPDEDNNFVAEKNHGYNFEVPASVEPGLVDPIPLKDMGRFNHEAVAVEPQSGVVYQTEDRHEGLLYRFIPNEKGKLAAGGRLQALAVSCRPSTDTRNWEQSRIDVGKRMPVEWIDMDNIESPNDDMRFRGFEAGAARFARGEGMWSGSDGIYFACTNGGSAKKGQIFRYVPSVAEGTPAEKCCPATLELFIEPNNSELVESADNLTVAPWGDVITCEDRSGDTVRIVGVTPRGKLYTFAKNHVNTEFAGATFSPDGSTLFVNLQGEGLTVAITGPWHQQRNA